MVEFRPPEHHMLNKFENYRNLTNNHLKVKFQYLKKNLFMNERSTYKMACFSYCVIIV